MKPMELAEAIEAALDRVIALPIERAAIEETAQSIRQVAKEARVVIAEAYPPDMLNEFSNALTPAFTRALPPPERPISPGGEPRPME